MTPELGKQAFSGLKRMIMKDVRAWAQAARWAKETENRCVPPMLALTIMVARACRLG
jgi:hypothetical protein